MSDPEDVTLYSTGASDKLHTRECPHLTAASLAVLVPATDEQLTDPDICSSCRKVLDGHRRQVFANIDEALHAFQTPLPNRPRIRELAAALPHGHIWVPASRSYIAIASEPGIDAAAYFGKTYADIRTGTGQYARQWLPERYATSTRSAAGHPQLPDAPTCPTCHQTLPRTGICDTCA